MRNLAVRPVLRDRLQEPASEELADMFAEAHALATESFERRLSDEMGKLRLDLAEMRFEILKWSFLFWIGQVAVIAGVFSVLVSRLR